MPKMDALFAHEPLRLEVPDAEIIYHPRFFGPETADDLFRKLRDQTLWQQDKIRVYGKEHQQPRLTALYGNEGKPYRYSNLTMHPHPWTLLLQKIKYQIESVAQTNFTTVLLNYYRDGKDSNGWHADDEPELGENPVIASVSLGAERWFHLRHNTLNLRQKILLEHGSLLLMQGTTQHFWKHQIPKTAQPIGGRINLTFRTLD